MLKYYWDLDWCIAYPMKVDGVLVSWDCEIIWYLLDVDRYVDLRTQTQHKIEKHSGLESRCTDKTYKFIIWSKSKPSSI
jgi:hypothetical protein